MKSQTIWILAHYASSPDLAGSTRHFDMARQLAKEGHNIVIFAASYIHNHFVDYKLAPGLESKIEIFDNVAFVWLRTFPYHRNDWRRYVNMLSYMIRVYRFGRALGQRKRLFSKPDIIIGSSVHLLAPLAGYRLAKHYRARFIMEVQDLWPQTLLAMGKFKPWNPVIVFLHILERFLYKKAESIIVVPPFAARYIGALGIAERNIVWIPNGVDTSLASLESPPPRKAGTLTAMYVGSFGETNNVELILKSAMILKSRGVRNVCFQLVGEGPKKKVLLAMKKEAELESVFISSSVCKSAIPGLLARADVLIHVEKDIPSLLPYGSSPNKFYDYLAAGKPIIVASNFVIDPVEAIGCGKKIDPNKADELAQALIHYAQLPQEERRKMGRKSRQYAEENYSMLAIVKRLKCVLAEKS